MYKYTFKCKKHVSETEYVMCNYWYIMCNEILSVMKTIFKNVEYINIIIIEISNALFILYIYVCMYL